MLDMSEEELKEALVILGIGTHQLKDIENQVVKNRHKKKKRTLHKSQFTDKV